jgi:hypothetical protein
MKLSLLFIALAITIPFENLKADVPQVVKISGTTLLNKILLDGSDPGVFQCLQCSFNATFQKFGKTGSGVNTAATYASTETMSDAFNNPIEPTMSRSVTNPDSYFSDFIALEINPSKDEAFIALQTSNGFNADPLGYHAVAVAITTTIENFSKVVTGAPLSVTFKEGVYSINGLDQAIGSYPGTIQIDANE